MISGFFPWWNSKWFSWPLLSSYNCQRLAPSTTLLGHVQSLYPELVAFPWLQKCQSHHNLIKTSPVLRLLPKLPTRLTPAPGSSARFLPPNAHPTLHLLSPLRQLPPGWSSTRTQSPLPDFAAWALCRHLKTPNVQNGSLFFFPNQFLLLLHSSPSDQHHHYPDV